MRRLKRPSAWLLIGLLLSVAGAAESAESKAIGPDAKRAELLVGRWYSSEPEEEEQVDNHYLIVRTSKHRVLTKSLHINHKTKEYCYETQLSTWSLKGERYTETPDGEKPGSDADLNGEVLELTAKVFRYHMIWEDGKDLIVEKRVVGPEFPLPKPPKGYANISVDEYYGF